MKCEHIPELETRGKRFLQVSLTQGRAFIDDLENNEGATFQLHALCLGEKTLLSPAVDRWLPTTVTSF